MDLKEIASKTIGLYTTVDEVMKKFPLGITINGIQRHKNDKDEFYYTATFEEALGYFMPMSAGDLKKLVDAWLAQGTLEEINEWFKKKKFHLLFTKIKHGAGKSYVKVLKYEVPEYDVIIDENGNEIDLDTGEVIRGIH